ncbi:prepilin-type N-terminal cleavage/methylation domain-containing protein [Phycisphaeraceae bacterium D3-23]
MYPRRHAFTLIELLVVISIIALLIAILLPALGAARRSAAKMKNSVSLRSLHQAQSTYAVDNNGYYTGLFPDGSVKTTIDLENEFGTGTGSFFFQNGTSVLPRFAILADGDYVAYEHIVSTQDTDREAWDGNTTFTHRNLSYAALDISVAGSSSRQAWRNDGDSRTPIFSDRSTSIAPTNIGSSLWDSDQWEGGVTWNDGHATFEPEPVVGTTSLGGETIEDDNLIDEATSDNGESPGSHVRMIKFNENFTNIAYPGGFLP